MSRANDYLHRIPQITRQEEAECYKDQDVFLYAENATFAYGEDHLIRTHGLGDKWDRKVRDLIRVIKIEDALGIKYQKTNILTPLMFAESAQEIPWHLNTQGILFVKASKGCLRWIREEQGKNRYGKHAWDQFWLPFCKDLREVGEGELLCIFNRRVAGWDGSRERPVIELLGAGGHLPTVWDEKGGCFRELDLKENFQKEFREELGGRVTRESITIFGGYQNDLTHELVVLCGIELEDRELKPLQEYAIQNLDEDTQGIYLGTFQDTIRYYRKNPAPFAGGAQAAPYNFPNCDALMERVFAYCGVR